MGLFRKARPQRGWISGDEAARRAERAHRKAAIRKAKKGKAAPPAYRETRRGWFS